MRNLTILFFIVFAKSVAWGQTPAPVCNNLFYVAQADRVQSELNFSNNRIKSLNDYVKELYPSIGTTKATYATTGTSEQYMRMAWKLNAKDDIRATIRKKLEAGIQLPASGQGSAHDFSISIEGISSQGLALNAQASAPSAKDVKGDLKAQIKMDIASAEAQILLHSELLGVYDRLKFKLLRECKLYSKKPEKTAQSIKAKQ